MYISKENSYVIPVDFFSLEEMGLSRAGKEKIKVVWLEASGCFGEAISLLNADEPDMLYLLKEVIDLIYLGSLGGDEGERAYERIINVLSDEYIFMVDGAIPVKDNGLFAVVANYKGKKITAMEAVNTIAKNAKHIIALGTCATYGGPTAAAPNQSEGKSLSDFLQRSDVINMPGCPINPAWTMGLLVYLASRGIPALDKDRRPVAYFGETIHTNCTRRKYFDKNIFAKKLGDKECMLKLGCKGPTTYGYCAISRWNDSDNWPIGDNTTCIGCMNKNFPDNGPFVNYGGNNNG